MRTAGSPPASPPPSASPKPSTSVDYLVIEGASRRPLTDADSTLAQRLAELGALDNADRDAVLHIIDCLIAKNHVRHALADAS